MEGTPEINQTNTGVNTPAEGETATPTPGSDQTTQATVSTPSTTTETKNEENGPIPYSRFREVNEKANQLEAKFKELEERFNKPATPEKPANPQLEAARQMIRELGFVPKEELEQELVARERRNKEDLAVQTELAKLEAKYDGKSGLPKFDRRKVVEFAIDRRIADPEVAYKTLFEKEYLNWHIQQATSNSKGVKTESSDGSGAKPAGDSRSDLEAAVAKGDDQAFNTLIKRSSLHQKLFGK